MKVNDELLILPTFVNELMGMTYKIIIYLYQTVQLRMRALFGSHAERKILIKNVDST